MEIAVAVGSREMDNLVGITASTVSYLKELGAEPFIVPCMGSHGGANADGQRAELEHLGITEKNSWCRNLLFHGSDQGRRTA